MGFFDLFRRPPAAGHDPAIAQIAEAACANLRALGLFVEAKRYDRFIEIRASTARKIVTTPGDANASGVALLLAPAFEPPALIFEQINSLESGLGRRMAHAVLATLRAHPGALTRVKVNDLSPVMSDGRRWWENVADDYADVDWVITHDPDDMLLPTPHLNEPRARDDAQEGFKRTQRKLAALARDFGYDADKVTLSDEKKTFDYLGQRFTSEGEALPGGRIIMYYDRDMSDARLGCCLAHEIQHARYFALREAYNAEAADGTLHRRFTKYTPELLAAQRGVSNYSNEHWDAWKGASPPRLFSDELAEGGSEPINESIAEVAKAYYNWGPDVRVNPLWKELHDAINDEYARRSASSNLDAEFAQNE